MSNAWLWVFGLGAGCLAVLLQQAEPSAFRSALAIGLLIAMFDVGHAAGQLAVWDKRASRGRGE